MARIPIPAPLLVLVSVICVQFGQSLGKSLFGSVGPAGVVALRLGLAAVVLLLVFRPGMPRGRSERGIVLALGTAIAGMNLIYPALVYLPVGLATSVQLMGPITLALVTSRRLLDALFVLIAGTGLWLFQSPEDAVFALPGLLLALASGAAMAAYLVLSKRAGAARASNAPLAWALVWGAVLTVPFGVAESGAALLAPAVLTVGLAVALLGAVAPYSLEMTALRRLRPGAVAVVQSLEPAAAGLAGVLILAEHLQPVQWVALGCVSVASAGTVAVRHAQPRCGEQSGTPVSPATSSINPDSP